MDVHIFCEVNVVFSTKRLSVDEIDRLWHLAQAVLNDREIDDDELEPTILWQSGQIIEFESENTLILTEKEISLV